LQYVSVGGAKLQRGLSRMGRVLWIFGKNKSDLWPYIEVIGLTASPIEIRQERDA
jgi:hypothetical protein